MTVDSIVNEVFDSFISFALYFENDENGIPLYVSHSKYDIPCRIYTEAYAEVLDFCIKSREVTKRNFPPDQLGVDFYFARNRSVTGFWDKPDIYGDHAKTLQEMAETYTSFKLNLS